MITFENFKKQVDSAEPPKAWRFGQFVFNFLYKEHPNLANYIRGTKKDPFHKSDNLDWEYLKEHWNDEFN